MAVENMSSDAAQDLEDAYVYAYPLVLMDTIRAMVTNTETPTADRAPLNQLFHSRDLATPALHSLTRPNVDTLYSQAYLDLGEEPYLLFKPETDRYCSIQPFDGYSNTPAVLGTGGVGGNDAVTYALIGPRFDGALPENVIPVPVSTDFVWLLLRVRCFGPPDLEEPRKIQDSMDLYPLSQHGEEHTYPRGSYTPDLDYVPVQHLQKMDACEYFDRFNSLVASNPGAPEDQPALDRFAALGIGAGLTFDPASLPKSVQERAGQLPGFMGSSKVNESRRMTAIDGWIYLDESIGNFGTKYLYRARIAHGGFANPVDVTAYPSTQVDSGGEPLTGTKTYNLHFEPGQLPPYGDWGWWSLTAYSASGQLFDNELDRYAIDDSQDLTLNDDGSLDLWISATNPGRGRERNWLPVRPENFGITLRIYFPHVSVNTHDWMPPKVTVVPSTEPQAVTQ
ncbi:MULTISPECIES: DUF1214 domain-containing protein [unclassified Rhodococcus (in: high G+C Gram-positive bacteria)]|uniref:DUF1254 domain-containing protein n=1 Tax=unclassified Rhodococcus (in: high G+C Gram-positive bacteria) TaxID=192944 RepID=UPI0009FC4BF6|nr:DUF1214 domain-containing protein [Rhodococcus sp. 1163]